MYELKTWYAGTNNTPSADAEVVIICERMHWTYEQYMQQPLWFLQGIAVALAQTVR